MIVAGIVILAMIVLAAALIAYRYHAGQAMPSAASSTSPGQGTTSAALVAERAPVCQKFNNLADAEKDPNDVCFLNLSGQGLTSFPTAVLQFPNLQYLDLSDNSIPSVPQEISQLTKLTDLWLGGNQLTAIPSSVGDMGDLVLLSLFQNQLTSLPSTLANLKYLAILGIKGNPINSTEKATLKTMLPKASII